jgi:hypothetical protein
LLVLLGAHLILHISRIKVKCKWEDNIQKGLKEMEWDFSQATPDYRKKPPVQKNSNYSG